MGNRFRSSCCFCGYCSIRCISVLVVFGAIFIKVINPILDSWIDPLPDSTNTINESNIEYDPTQTDVLGLQLGFLKDGVDDPELKLGITFILRQSFPRWIIKLLDRYEHSTSDDDDTRPLNETYQDISIDILDARNTTRSVPFNETGFTLIDMNGMSSINTVKNWRSPTEIVTFQDELKPFLYELFPHASKIVFTYNVVRGGNQFGDQPAAIGGLHLDYSQNDTARTLFHERFPIMDQAREQGILLGMEDTDEEEFKVMLGVWKPFGMTTPVCDHPLAVMDARTFRPEHATSKEIHINFGVMTFHNLNGGVRYNPDQQLYYYSFQQESEVLIFTQYTRDEFKCNPHTSFINPNCPPDYDSRVSVEMRAAVFFPKHKE